MPSDHHKAGRPHTTHETTAAMMATQRARPVMSARDSGILITSNSPSRARGKAPNHCTVFEVRSPRVLDRPSMTSGARKHVRRRMSALQLAESSRSSWQNARWITLRRSPRNSSTLRRLRQRPQKQGGLGSHSGGRGCHPSSHHRRGKIKFSSRWCFRRLGRGGARCARCVDRDCRADLRG